MLAVVCVSRFGVAALPLSLSRAPVRLSLRALRSSAAAMAGTASGTVETAEFEVDGEIVRAERFVEADVGMTFSKASLDEKLFSRPWPDEWPFPPQAFRRQDESDDADFYAVPRFCYHIDEGAVRALTNYYAENIAPGAAILDICSSWVSHYPADFPDTMGRIAGTGMNVHELRCNAQLSEHSPRDLNADPTLPYEDGSFDVATCVVSVDYLSRRRYGEISGDIGRQMERWPIDKSRGAGATHTLPQRRAVRQLGCYRYPE